ncbi:MAG: TusE/DsrC/DsvC family sulfur relay protein [Actinobacteria bacterium]|jgi:tRNA 2-thiouridine synthesizing protein E|nr:TusE/DsrC/DsvC family sulfur relay protein [Actinomycetota bacterium]
MTTKLLAGQDVEVDAEGFLVDPSQWNEEVARAMAKEEGIDTLTDKHMQVINFMRSEYMAKGTAPNIRSLGKTSGVSVKELYQLFPKGPAKLAAKLGGISKPHGCI